MNVWLWSFSFQFILVISYFPRGKIYFSLIGIEAEFLNLNENDSFNFKSLKQSVLFSPRVNNKWGST